MQIITNNAGKELKKHGDSAFPFLVSYERLSGYETGSFSAMPTPFTPVTCTIIRTVSISLSPLIPN